MQAQTLHFFISYADEDFWVALQIAQGIENAGHTTFLARRDVKAGRFQDVILSEIRKCHAVVVLITPTSVESPWVQYELGAADIINRLIVPILQGRPSILPDILKSRHVYEINSVELLFGALGKFKEVATGTEPATVPAEPPA